MDASSATATGLLGNKRKADVESEQQQEEETDDDDYLSDKYLIEPENQTCKVDPRWSLPKWKRKDILEEKQKRSHKQKKQKQVLQDGLEKKLDESNKGFALLAKMGYSPGTGLGKNNTGRTEPVPLNLKQGRSGIGMKTAQEKKKEAQEAMVETIRARRNLSFSNLKASFSQAKRREYQERIDVADLSTARHSCEALDSQRGIARHEYWHPLPLPVDVNENEVKPLSEFESLPVSEKLATLTSYLRTTYGYCQWCGSDYSQTELIQQCPGPTRDDHS